MQLFLLGLFIGTILGYFLARRYLNSHNRMNARRHAKSQPNRAMADDGIIYAAQYGNDLILIRIDRDDGEPSIKLDPDSAYIFGQQVIGVSSIGYQQAPQHAINGTHAAPPSQQRLPYNGN